MKSEIKRWIERELNVGTWEIEPDGTTCHWSVGLYDLLARPSNTHISIASWIEAAHDDHRETLRTLFAVQPDGHLRQAIVGFRQPDGSVLSLVALAHAEHRDGGVWRHGAMLLPPATAPARLISGHHVRAARALLNWNTGDFVRASRLSASTLRRIEGAGPAAVSDDSWVTAERALAEAGVRFEVYRGQVRIVGP